MELRRFKVERYRSISSATLDLRDMTVLVGPNNEGKSNILRAMVLGMTALGGFAQFDSGSKYRMAQYMRGPVDYEWDRDFPMNQRSGSSKTTALEFDFLLDDDEVTDFESVVGSKINGDLKVKLSFSQDGSVSIRIVKKRAGKVWTTKAGKIAAFVGSRIGVEYVPSVRTSGEAERVVARLVAQELRTLEQQTEYREALKVIEDLQRPRLQEIGRSVQETLAHFLPDVTSVEINLVESRRYMGPASRSVEIVVDDGHATSLDRKGDGIQSLAAIALLRRAAMDRGRNRTFVLAVEEPEAHLHPFAVRELRTVLGLIAQDQQVVLTTHSPLLADPLHVDRNVIVEESKAKAARSIADVRTSLGVRLEDNLQSARLVLVTEGEHDVAALTTTLSSISPVLAEHLGQGALVIEGLGGGGKLKYRLSQYSGGVCATYVLVDNDQQGRAAVESALEENLISDADYVLSTFPGKNESELEDFVDPTAYLDAINQAFGLQLKRADVLRGRKKWSQRIGTLIEARGKVWNAAAERKAKSLVSMAVQGGGVGALLPDGVTALTEVARRLEQMLGHEPSDVDTSSDGPVPES
jgi:putative ATP-dependent endonuclease of OLD family